MFSNADYLRARPLTSLDRWPLILVLASPLALAAAALGALPLWRRNQPLAIVLTAALFLYLNEFWLAPLGRGTTLNLLRGLSVLAIPVSAAAGLALAGRRRALVLVVSGCALWLGASAITAVPRACFVRDFDPQEVHGVEVDRCTFRWKAPQLRHRDRVIGPGG